MAFPESFLQELAERNDIVDVVSGYVALTKRSGSNMFGLCPFHSEKTPSFSVSPDKQIYHCFGCGKGGSVINFIMEIENLSFPEAVEFLARRAGMEVPENGDREQRSRQERLLALNKEAARFFYGELVKPEGKTAQDYIARRQISPSMVKNFGLGYAPDSFYALTDAMHGKGYQDYELIAAGLANTNKSGKGVHDIFRNRLMFPVIDVRGSVIGFSGRILGDGEPKYLNTRETPVFNKSRNLFALNLAKKSKRGYIILSEGNVDVVSLHQAGFDCAVASLGTSLTPEQARLISRYTQQVIIAYDNDEAGKKASQRAIGILEKLDMRVRVLRMDGAKDPDEFIKSKGADAFAALIERSENHIEYRLQTVRNKYDMSDPEGKVSFLREAAELIASLPGSVEREVYGLRAAQEAEVSHDAVKSEIEAARRRLAGRARKREERSELRPLKAAQPVEKSIRYDDSRSATAEAGLLRLMINDPTLDLGTDPPEESDFTVEFFARLYLLLRERAEHGEAVSMAVLSGLFSADELSHISRIMQQPEDPQRRTQAMADYIQIIKEKKFSTDTASDLLALQQKLKETKGYGG